MDAVTFAINSVLNSDIPTRILDDAFITKTSRLRRDPLTLEQHIRDKVWFQRVQPDLNRAGGVLVDINLVGLPNETLKNYERIYKVPLWMTNNAKIIGIHKVTLNVTSNFAERAPGQTPNSMWYAPVEQNVRRIIAGNRPLPQISTSQVEGLTGNVIKIRDFQNFRADVTISCKVEIDDDFSMLAPVYHLDLAELMEEATKAYIYRTLDLEIDQAKLDGGRELGRYRAIVDEFRDSHKTYRDLINTKWHKIAQLNDKQRSENHILNAGKTRF